MKSKLEPFKDEVIRMYVNENLTCKQIGHKFKLRPGTVSSFLTKYNIKLRNAGQQKGRTGTNKGKKFTERTIAYNTHLIESGDYKMLHEAGIRSRVRKYLINKYGHKCQICGLAEWREHIIPLVCDHIDGSAKNCELDNFRVICNNCDSILPTYKGKNRGNGRKLNGSVTE
jgi:5-methylcytosine-specific restriction endonuclease McrA